MQQQVLSRYLDYLTAERNASRYTLRNYKADLQHFFAFLTDDGIVSLREVDRQSIRRYLSRLSDDGFARSSIARKLSAVRSFFRYLRREEILVENPMAGISSPKLDKRLPAFLTADEAKRLVETTGVSKPEGQRDRAILEVFYASGLRVSELAGINKDDVDLTANEIRVVGKGAKERIVLMGQPAAAALTAYMDEGRHMLLGDRKNSALFVNRYGNRLAIRRIQKIVEACSRRLNKRVHPHMLRHTFATHMLDGGADLRVVQELLGHASLSSTQIYTHVTKAQARKIYLSAHPMAQKHEDSE